MPAHALRGGCHCGAIRVELELPREPAAYTPRACDCSFCRKHGAAYFSDPAGRLHLEVRDQTALGRYRQGNALAEFLFCKCCGVLVAVIYAEDARRYATVNSRVIDGDPGFPDATTVSPQTLAPDDKVARWKAVWFGGVTLAGDGTGQAK
ncbi:aldehyde-activating protein [Aromatoleum toluolicum]|uniref:Aldehyde-activating protein n=1 Tax=Aromatoleum toluolicum TaxID=90060 RepID=A0ABX1NNH0_9RHOO|nr:aldehyde-activating protein [Aromatoleum toluolicum]NMG00691.1 aldehyde-activating protein [Aromatoleum toluolicum]